MFRLDGKVAAIVGAGSGIGEAVARGAAAQGAAVVCLDANETAAAAVAAGLGGESAAVDIRDGDGVAAAFDRIVKQRGRLDIVVCTPSINVRKLMLNYTEEEF